MHNEIQLRMSLINQDIPGGHPAGMSAYHAQGVNYSLRLSHYSTVKRGCQVFPTKIGKTRPDERYVSGARRVTAGGSHGLFQKLVRNFLSFEIILSVPLADLPDDPTGVADGNDV